MKTTHLFAAVCAATLGLGTALAGGEGWTSNFDEASKQAAGEKKDLLIDFTGSDWCGWCIKLNEEVFQHDAFKDGVTDMRAAGVMTQIEQHALGIRIVVRRTFAGQIRKE